MSAKLDSIFRDGMQVEMLAKLRDQGLSLKLHLLPLQRLRPTMALNHSQVGCCLVGYGGRIELPT